MISSQQLTGGECSCNSFRPKCSFWLPLSQIIQWHNISFPCYLDNRQIRLLRPDDLRSLAAVLDCLTDVHFWIVQNFLQLNNSKSEIILFSPPNPISHIVNALDFLSDNAKPHARNLEVICDSDLTFQPHICKFGQSCFLKLRFISRIKSILSHSDLEKVINTLIFSRLDNCNSLLSGINHKLLGFLQLIENAAVAFNWF